MNPGGLRSHLLKIREQISLCGVTRLVNEKTFGNATNTLNNVLEISHYFSDNMQVQNLCVHDVTANEGSAKLFQY